MISYDCQMQGLSCDARRIREPGRQVNSLLRPLAAQAGSNSQPWSKQLIGWWGERPREPRQPYRC